MKLTHPHLLPLELDDNEPPSREEQLQILAMITRDDDHAAQFMRSTRNRMTFRQCTAANFHADALAWIARDNQGAR